MFYQTIKELNENFNFLWAVIGADGLIIFILLKNKFDYTIQCNVQIIKIAGSEYKFVAAAVRSRILNVLKN